MSTYPQVRRGHLSRVQPSLALWRSHVYYSEHEETLAMKRISDSSAHTYAFTSVLLMVRHEDHAVVDRQSLRRLGLRNIRVLTSGVDAARLLCGYKKVTDGLPFPDFAFCDEQLSDMAGIEFLNLIRSHPKLFSFPVIMAINRDTPAIRKSLEDLACSGIVVRPYSGDAFINQMARAAAMHPPHKDPAYWHATKAESNAFELALSRISLAKKVSDQTSSQWYREGLLCLKHGQWEEATVAFQQALREHAGHEDAIRGLTLALRKRQEQAEAAQQGKRHLSKEQAETLRDNLVKASHSDNPEEAIRQVIASLDNADPPPSLPAVTLSNDMVVEASSSKKKRKKGEARPTSSPGNGHDVSSPSIALLPALREPDGSGFIGRFPLLRDAVNVAKVTLGLYKIKK